MESHCIHKCLLGRLFAHWLRFYSTSQFEDARFAVKSHAFDVSVCKQAPEQTFMNTMAFHRGEVRARVKQH